MSIGNLKFKEKWYDYHYEDEDGRYCANDFCPIHLLCDNPDEPDRFILNEKWFRAINVPVQVSMTTYKELIYRPNGRIVTDLRGDDFYEYELVK